AVELELLGRQCALKITRRQVEERRPDRLVRVLRVLAALVVSRLLRQGLLAVRGENVLANLSEGLVRDPRRVGPHVGNEPDAPPVADVLAFVEELRDPHGARHGEPGPARGVLLQLARRERRRRVLPLLLGAYFR